MLRHLQIKTLWCAGCDVCFISFRSYYKHQDESVHQFQWSFQLFLQIVWIKSPWRCPPRFILPTEYFKNKNVHKRNSVFWLITRTVVAFGRNPQSTFVTLVLLYQSFLLQSPIVFSNCRLSVSEPLWWASSHCRHPGETCGVKLGLVNVINEQKYNKLCFLCNAFFFILLKIINLDPFLIGNDQKWAVAKKKKSENSSKYF